MKIKVYIEWSRKRLPKDSPCLVAFHKALDAQCSFMHSLVSGPGQKPSHLIGTELSK